MNRREKELAWQKEHGVTGHTPLPTNKDGSPVKYESGRYEAMFNAHRSAVEMSIRARNSLQNTLKEPKQRTTLRATSSGYMMVPRAPQLDTQAVPEDLLEDAIEI